MKKLLYIGTLAKDSTSYARYIALTKIFNVEAVEFQDINLGLNRLKEKFNLNKKIKQKRILDKVQKDFCIIWFDKPTYVDNEFLRALRMQNTDAKLVAHVTDDLSIKSHHFKDFIECGEYFSFIFTCNRFNIAEYPELPLYYNELGFDEAILKIDVNGSDRSFDIVFVGHYEPYYLKKLNEIALQAATKGLTVNVFGTGWWRALLFPNKPSNLVIKTGWISRYEMIKVYKSCKIAVALYSQINRNEMSGRILELASMGIPFLVKNNKTIEENIQCFYDINSIHENEFWDEICNDYEVVKARFLKFANCYNHSTWSSRVNSAVSILDHK